MKLEIPKIKALHGKPTYRNCRDLSSPRDPCCNCCSNCSSHRTSCRFARVLLWRTGSSLTCEGKINAAQRTWQSWTWSEVMIWDSTRPLFSHPKFRQDWALCFEEQICAHAWIAVSEVWAGSSMISSRKCQLNWKILHVYCSIYICIYRSFNFGKLKVPATQQS